MDSGKLPTAAGEMFWESRLPLFFQTHKRDLEERNRILLRTVL
jgi:hypothetical protein